MKVLTHRNKKTHQSQALVSILLTQFQPELHISFSALCFRRENQERMYWASATFKTIKLAKQNIKEINSYFTEKIIAEWVAAVLCSFILQYK